MARLPAAVCPCSDCCHTGSPYILVYGWEDTESSVSRATINTFLKEAKPRATLFYLFDDEDGDPVFVEPKEYPRLIKELNKLMARKDNTMAKKTTTKKTASKTTKTAKPAAKKTAAKTKSAK